MECYYLECENAHQYVPFVLNHELPSFQEILPKLQLLQPPPNHINRELLTVIASIWSRLARCLVVVVMENRINYLNVKEVTKVVLHFRKNGLIFPAFPNILLFSGKRTKFYPSKFHDFCGS